MLPGTPGEEHTVHGNEHGRFVSNCDIKLRTAYSSVQVTDKPLPSCLGDSPGE